MSIWKSPLSISEINEFCKSTMLTALNITVTEIGDDYVKGDMPVTDAVKQPLGIVHGAAFVSLAESLASIAGMMCVDTTTHYSVGTTISASYIKSIREGIVTGVARPLHIGSTSQVWDITIESDKGVVLSVIRLTLANLDISRHPEEPK